MSAKRKPAAVRHQLEEEKGPGAGLSLRAPTSQFLIAQENPRKIRGPGEVERLTKSIATHGVLQPVIAYSEDGGLHVTAGGTRLMAAVKAGVTTLPYVLLDKDRAIRAGLAEQDGHTALHPADQAAAYADALQRAMGVYVIDDPKLKSEARAGKVLELANALGVAPRFFEQRLKLATLHKPILEALRHNKLSVHQAAAWANASDEQQVALWKTNAGRAPRLDPFDIKQLVDKADVAENDRLAKFAGKEYAAAGGEKRTELFAFDDEDRIIEDPKARPASFIADKAQLQACAREKLEAAAEKFKAEGWGFAEFTLATSHGAPPRFTKGKACTTKADKAKAGVFLSIGDKGEIQVTRNLRKPKAKQEPEAKAAPSSASAKYAASAAIAGLNDDFCTAASMIVARTIAQRPGLALAVLLATLVRLIFHPQMGSQFWNATRVEIYMPNEWPELTSDADWVAAEKRWFKLLQPAKGDLVGFILRMPDGQRQELLAFCTACTFETIRSQQKSETEDLTYIAEIAKPDPAAHWTARAEDVFKWPPPLVKRACADLDISIDGLSQTEAAERIAQAAKIQKWVPPLIRELCGHAADKPKPKAKAKKAATVKSAGLPGFDDAKVEKSVNKTLAKARKKSTVRAEDREEIGA